MDRRASLPAIGRLVTHDDVVALIAKHGRASVVDALRRAVDAARASDRDVTNEDVIAAASRALSASVRGTLVPAINASGVVLHTNLGRAPLCEEAREAIVSQGSGYSSIELDLSSGERGSRHVHASARLRRITGAEDALVANNAAAALLLALTGLSEVIVSRGELVEIGGAFRIPEIVEVGGARLVEVGTTNRTRLEDYRVALAANPSATILKVHRSNFAIVGFTEEASVAELVSLGAPVVHDLGSGLLTSGVLHAVDEPDVAASVRDGADVVVFSGDKLLGGPQAGLAVGKSAAISRMRKLPLMRAVRAGKLVLAALDATLAVYERGAAPTLPTIAAINASAETVRARAEAMRAAIGQGEIVETIARVGAGSQPLATLPSFAVRLDVDAVRVATSLRESTPVVIGRIENGAYFLDARAVSDGDVATLAERVRAAIESACAGPIDAAAHDAGMLYRQS